MRVCCSSVAQPCAALRSLAQPQPCQREREDCEERAGRLGDASFDMDVDMPVLMYDRAGRGGARRGAVSARTTAYSTAVVPKCGTRHRIGVGLAHLLADSVESETELCETAIRTLGALNWKAEQPRPAAPQPIPYAL